MIAVGKENKKIKIKDRWNYFHHKPMLSLLGVNNCLPLFHMAKRFIWLNEKKKRMNEFTIGYMINPGLNVNRDFREKVEKCMYTKFGEITQHFIKSKLAKKNISVLALIMFYGKISDNTKKDYRVLSCGIYTTIKIYVCIDDLSRQFF